MKVRDRLHVSDRVQAGLVRFLQLVMVGILVAGVSLGSLGAVVNATIGLLVTELPALLRRNYQFTMDVGVVLWLTVAMFLHALGTLPLPGFGLLAPYSSVWWWDHLTHVLSSSLVAGAAYATTRALDEHSEFIDMPPLFMFVYLLLFVMAFGVVWELLEFYVGAASRALGAEAVLVQYGLEDTLLDLVYNALGGLLVATFGTAHLTDVSDQLTELLDRRSTGR